MQHTHATATSVKAKANVTDQDAGTASAPLPIDAGVCGTTDVQAMMAAGGNQAMAELSASDAAARRKGDKNNIKKDTATKADSRDAEVTPAAPQTTTGVSKGASTGLKAGTSKVKRKTSVSKMSGAGPNASSIHTGYGVCDTEEVKPTITVAKEGTDYKVSKVDFEGIYSIICTLPGGITEVTGPSGNTTATNYMKQAKDLNDLGELGGTLWYMLAAVVAHEAVHETSLAPALVAVEATMAAKFTSLKVAESDTIKSESAAAAAIKALPAYASAVSSLRDIWDAKYVQLITGDHNTKTPAAEHAVVDPMVASINTWADAQTPKLPKFTP